MFCWMTASINYLIQCWFLNSEVLWHSSETNLTANAQAAILYNEFEKHTFEIIAESPMGKLVNE